MTKPEHMYAALTYYTLQLDNTHVLWGNTKHAPLKKKFVLPKLKVQSVHEYMYTTKTNGTQDIRVSYHGGINNCDMQRSFNTGDAMYKKWIADAEFKATDWELKGAHQCRSEKMKNRKQNVKA